MTTRLLLIRHGATVLSAEDRFAGSTEAVIRVAEEVFGLVSRAYETLGERESRFAYIRDQKGREREAAELGWGAMHERLRQVDPEAAARIHPNDPQRLQRALEVYELTGVPLSRLQQGGGEPLPYRVLPLVVAPSDRDRLRERVALRFHLMLEQGLLAEVEALYRRGDLSPHKPSIRCVGYRQVWSYLAGEAGYDTMVAQAITATRQLAKRQLTWLRGEPDAQWFDAVDGKLLEKVLKLVAASAIN